MDLQQQQQQLRQEQQLSTAHIDLLNSMASAMGGLSLACSLSALASILRARRQRQTKTARQFQTLLLWLFAADSVIALGLFLSFLDRISWLCRLQGSLIQLGGLGSFFYTAAISLELYSLIVRDAAQNDVWAPVRAYHAVAWPLCALSVALLLAFDYIGPSTANTASSEDLHYAWCWVKPGDVLARYLPFYVPLVACFALSVAVYGRVVLKLRQAVEGQGRATAYKLLLFPAIFVVTWAPALANRTQQVVAPQQPSFALFLLHSIFAPLGGVADTAAYALTNRRYRRELLALVSCGRRGGGGDGDDDEEASLLEAKPP